MPVAAPEARRRRPRIHRLRLDLPARAALEAAGVDPSSIWRTPDAWGDFGPHLDAWIEEAAHALAYASVAAISVIDFAAIVIDGAMPTDVRDRLLTASPPSSKRSTGAASPTSTIIAGRVGADARAIGGAALPLIKNFARDREVLFKDVLERSRRRQRCPFGR